MPILSPEVIWFGNRTLAIYTSYLPLFLSLFGFGRAECRRRPGKTTSSRFEKNGVRIKAIYIRDKKQNLGFSGCHVPGNRAKPHRIYNPTFPPLEYEGIIITSLATVEKAQYQSYVYYYHDSLFSQSNPTGASKCTVGFSAFFSFNMLRFKGVCWLWFDLQYRCENWWLARRTSW